MRTKTGIMLGSWRNKRRSDPIMEDLVAVGCDVLTLGQYLQPTKKHLAVQRFVHPDEFAELREIGYELGFDYVESGPLVRSSYHSEKHVIRISELHREIIERRKSSGVFCITLTRSLK
jgi:lipoic acid synthetase